MNAVLLELCYRFDGSHRHGASRCFIVNDVTHLATGCGFNRVFGAVVVALFQKPFRIRRFVRHFLSRARKYPAGDAM